MITCNKCGAPFPPTPAHWYFQHGKPKQPCRVCTRRIQAATNRRNRKRQGPKTLTPRLCRFCEEMFTPVSKFANRRHHCYREECVVKARRLYDEHRVINAKRWRKNHRPKQFQQCPICSKYRMDPKDHFSCRVCRKQAGDCSGNWVYATPCWEREETNESR